MKLQFRNLLALLLCASLHAQVQLTKGVVVGAATASGPINVDQIVPGADGQIVTTIDGVSAWGDAGSLGPYVPVTGAPSGAVSVGGILGYGDTPATGIADATNLFNQPGVTPDFSHGGFSWIYIDGSGGHQYLGGINDLGYLGMTQGVAGTFCGGQNSLASLADLLAFNNKGVGTYISFNEMDGSTSGTSHIANITNVGSTTGGWSFDTGDITGTTLTQEAFLSRSGDLTLHGILGPSTAPTGACPINGLWVFSQDGHGTVCLFGTWVSKI